VTDATTATTAAKQCTKRVENDITESRLPFMTEESRNNSYRRFYYYCYDSDKIKTALFCG